MARLSFTDDYPRSARLARSSTASPQPPALYGLPPHVGLVATEKVGRVRTCKLGLRRLEQEAAWITRYHQLWEARFDELDKIVEDLKRKEKVDGRKKRK